MYIYMIYLGTMVVVCWEKALSSHPEYFRYTYLYKHTHTLKHTHVEYTVNMIRKPDDIIHVKTKMTMMMVI